MSTMTQNDLQAAVMYLLRQAAERKYEGFRPDYTVGFEVTAASRAVRGWEQQYDAAVAERAAEAEVAYARAERNYEEAVRDEMRAQWADLKAHGVARLRLALGSRYLPRDLRAWAKRQYGLAIKSRNPWAVALVILTLRDAVEWEQAHDALADEDRLALQHALGEEQARWVAKQSLDEVVYDGLDQLRSTVGVGEPRA